MAAAEELSNGNWRVYAANGESYDFSSIDWEVAVENTPSATMPAAPGTYLVSPNREDNSPPYWRSNILGWLVAADGAIRPAVLEPTGAPSDWTILHPDGRVEDHAGSSWDDAAEWLADIGVSLP
jgi:hypothetical protein